MQMERFRALVLAGAVPAFACVLLCTGCKSLEQTNDNTVAVRLPGSRLIEELREFDGEARRHLPYAWMAQAAYEKTPAAQDEPRSCQDADEALKNDWIMWNEFPSEDLKAKIHKYHLRVEVWSKRRSPEVVVAFGGTIFNNRNDWTANLRWFIPNRDDQYTIVVRELAHAFKKEIKQKIISNVWRGSRPKLVTTGHSLGGGLAQQMAYALPEPDDDLRVSEVYAFHPSPVTGYFSVEERLRKANAKGLIIERIYERGEILAVLRSVQNMVFKPSVIDPAVSGYRYSVIRQVNPINNHSIGNFACALATKLQRGEAQSK